MDNKTSAEIKIFDKYIKEMSVRYKKDPISSQKEALEALKRTGVVNRKGKTKEKIISWG